MNVIEVRETIKALTEMYFKYANVVYAKQSFMTKPTKPLVTLSFGTVNRPLNPPTKIIDGYPVSFYPSTMLVQIDLFTLGNKKELKKDVYVMENTAENDMLLFFNFLNSPYAVRYCNEHDIAIVLNNSVQDLTGIINDTEYEFRAMLEFEVRFTQLAVGDTGTLSPDNIKKDNEGNTIITPDKSDTGSSGGNDGLKDNEGEYFTNVRINKKLMKEEKLNEFKS